MRRRELAFVLAGAALFRAGSGRAQEPRRIYRLGVIEMQPRTADITTAMFDELHQSGFVEGQNLRVVGRFSQPEMEAPKDAAAIVAAGVDAILCSGKLARIVQQATREIPILTLANDLVAMGLVGSLAHPDGNTTGISILATELDGKRQELLRQLVPTARHVAALADPGVTAPAQLRALEDAARARGIELSIHRAAKPGDIVPAIEAAKEAGAQALNVLASVLFESNYRLIIERAGTLKLPAIYQWPENAEAGGLLAYGPRHTEVFRQRARQLVKILRGAKPADIPIEQPAKFELVVNLKTAKALGLTVPQSILARADEVVE